MFESLSDRLEGAFDVLKGNHKITELNIADSIKQIRRALVEADVSFKIAKDFTNTRPLRPSQRKVLDFSTDDVFQTGKNITTNVARTDRACKGEGEVTIEMHVATFNWSDDNIMRTSLPKCCAR